MTSSVPDLVASVYLNSNANFHVGAGRVPTFSDLSMRLCNPNTFSLDTQEPSKVYKGYWSKETTVH